MKLLFISHLYPNSLEPGKAPFHRGLVHALAQRATVEVIAPVFRRPGRKLPPEEEIIDGVTVRHPRIWYVPGVFVHQHWRMYRTSMRRYLRAQIAEFKPDHVLIGYLYPDGTAVGPLCRELGIPYSIRVAGSDFRVRIKQPKFRDTVLWTLQDAPLIFTHGNALKRDIEAALRNAGPRDGPNAECGMRNAECTDVSRRGAEMQRNAGLQDRANAETPTLRHSDTPTQAVPPHAPIQSLLTPDTRGAQVVSVYNGVDRETFFRRYRKEAREVLGEGEQKIVLFVGNLVDVKAPSRLLRAWQIHQQSGNETTRSNRATPIPARSGFLPAMLRIALQAGATGDAGGLPHLPAVALPQAIQAGSHTPTLILIGSGPLENKMQRLAEKLGIADHVQFLGQLPQDQVALWMNAADCLVLPSKSEGTPNVVLEALACGTPVVATPVGEVPDLVHDGVNGYVTDDIADGISKVLDREWDRETIAAGVAGFTWEATAGTILTAVSKNT